MEFLGGHDREFVEKPLYRAFNFSGIAYNLEPLLISNLTLWLSITEVCVAHVRYSTYFYILYHILLYTIPHTSVYYTVMLGVPILPAPTFIEFLN